MMLLRIFLLLMFSLPAFAINTWQQAFDACNSSKGPSDYCKTYYETDICGVSMPSGAQGYIRREWDGFSNFCGTSNIYSFGDDGCSTDMQRDPIAGVCVCPSGQVDDGSGGCMAQPSECSSEQIAYACGSQICTGSYVASFSCFITSPPSGCEAGVKSFNGCDLVCLGESTSNQEGTACIDPTCPDGFYLENHSCVANPIECTSSQTQCQGSCFSNPSCAIGYAAACDSESVSGSSPVSCQFFGCPDGTVQQTLNGASTCIKSGITTSGTQTTEGTSTGQQSTTTNNPDGSTSTSTTTTTSNTTSTSSIELDTGGLAQESTQVGILDELKKLNQGKSFEGQSGGSLYESNEKTYSGILGEFKNRIMQAPIATVGNSFFDIQLSGNCPIWVLPATDLTPSIPIDMQCSDAMNSIWPLVAAVVIASASFIAFRWAFL
jgi:hypothetical protein